MVLPIVVDLGDCSPGDKSVGSHEHGTHAVRSVSEVSCHNECWTMNVERKHWNINGHQAIIESPFSVGPQIPMALILANATFQLQLSTICLFSILCLSNGATELSNSLQPQRGPNLRTSFSTTPSIPLCRSTTMTSFVLSNPIQANFAQGASDYVTK